MRELTCCRKPDEYNGPTKHHRNQNDFPTQIAFPWEGVRIGFVQFDRFRTTIAERASCFSWCLNGDYVEMLIRERAGQTAVEIACFCKANGSQRRR